MPASVIGPDDLAQLLLVLGGSYLLDLARGRVRVIATWLPGPAVSAILPCLDDGIMRVVLDPEKPNAYAHARAMLCTWWESYLAPEYTEQGTVSIVRQRAPRVEMVEPLRLSVAENETV